MPRMYAVDIQSINLSRRDRPQLLADVSLQIGAGECFALMGVNGAGKTSLIKAMLDLVAVDSGHISLFGDRHQLRHARGHLAYLPERFQPAHHQTGAEFLRLMLALHGLEYSRDAALAAAQRLDLAPTALDEPARRYSKGMTQKLGLIYALLSQRPLLVLDEPLSGLDPCARHAVLDELAKARAAGRTLFISTHLLNDVAPLCDRIGILHGGRMRFCGTPADCCRQFAADDLESAYLACIAAIDD